MAKKIKAIRPTAEQTQWGKEENWSDKECSLGYAEMSFDGSDSPLMICKIDCMEVFADDLQASKQAAQDGYKLMFLPNNKKWSPLCYGGIIATKENLAKTLKYIEDNEWTFDGNSARLAEDFKSRVWKQYKINL